MNIFVKKSDRVEVEVFVYEDADKIVKAVGKDSEVPPGTDAKILKFSFRRPSYQDSMAILKAAQVQSPAGGVTFDGAAFQDSMMKTLLVGWNLAAVSGEETPFSLDALNTLTPTIARMVATSAIDKLQL